MTERKTPWLWIPTLYLAEGIPYFLVNTIALIMFKDFGMDNGTLALLTSLISLPWVLKPFWSPFVDILRSKRWWIVAMQLLITGTVSLLALSVKTPTLGLSIGLFTIVAFASATHDIAADGYYMIALDAHSQSSFIGIRNTFYRIAMVFGQGVLVVLAGYLERKKGDVPEAWSITLAATAIFFAVISLYHFHYLPKPDGDRTAEKMKAAEIFRGFGRSFATFFTKKGIWTAMAFLLLYRLPEALSIKMLYPLFKDSPAEGGLGLGAEEFGMIYGTFGVIALLAGGILGGLAAGKWGLKRIFLPMAASLALPCCVYLILAVFQPGNLWLTGALVCLDQFGYGFGFTAYTLYMIYFSRGEFRTSHYAICTAFMALSMMIPGFFAGYLQEALGYIGFFIAVMVCCTATFAVTVLAGKDMEINYGSKNASN